MSLEFNLTYAGVPLVLDVAKVVRMPSPLPSPGAGGGRVSPLKHQAMADMVDELDRLIPFGQMQDLSMAAPYPGRNTGALAVPWKQPLVIPEIKIGDWWYPNSASRWSIFRGLATSSQVKAMLAATGGSNPATFKMEQNPLSPGNPSNSESNYTVSTSMYMLPPRPLAEHGGSFDGLYLVTLVDERYWWQYNPVSLRVNANSTWTGIIAQLATALNVTVNYDPVPAVYQTPEPDSQFWTNAENAALLLDAVAYNIGSVVCRNFDGTYTLRNAIGSLAVVAANRVGLSPSADLSQISRMAGGDIFNSGTGTGLPVGDLTNSRNSVLPAIVRMAFPKYVAGDDPVPHFSNPRILPPRPSAWYEEGYGDTYNVDVPLSSGAGNFGSGFFVSGLAGVSGATHTIHCTAKALFSGEVQLASGQVPMNVSGMQALAYQLAYDFYNQQTVSALDEVYPGIYAWTPEGFHDVVWSYSARDGRATTRVARTEWNMIVREMQHSTPPPSGQVFWASGAVTGNASGQPLCYVPPGVGGPSVAQTVRDSWTSGNVGGASGTVVAVFASSGMGSGDTAAILAAVDYLPTQNRWWGRSDGEIMMLEGTSGGITSGGTASGYVVGVVYRGIQGTLVGQHSSGFPAFSSGSNSSGLIFLVNPNTAYGVNLTTYEKGQFVAPAEWTSGGMQGVRILPQNQNVKVRSAAGVGINGVTLYSGTVEVSDTTQNGAGQFIDREAVWVQERNGGTPVAGNVYPGQLFGYSASGPVAPVYGINVGDAAGASTTASYARTYLSGGSFSVLSGNVVVSGGFSVLLALDPSFQAAAPAGWNIGNGIQLNPPVAGLFNEGMKLRIVLSSGGVSGNTIELNINNPGGFDPNGDAQFVRQTFDATNLSANTTYTFECVGMDQAQDAGSLGGPQFGFVNNCGAGNNITLLGNGSFVWMAQFL